MVDDTTKPYIGAPGEPYPVTGAATREPRGGDGRKVTEDSLHRQGRVPGSSVSGRARVPLAVGASCGGEIAPTSNKILFVNRKILRHVTPTEERV